MQRLIDNNNIILKAIIFDFDGVIAESVQVKTDAFKQLYSPFGKEIVEKVTKHHEANGGVSRYNKIKYYHKMFLDTELTSTGVNELASQFGEIVIDKVIKSPYVSGSVELIKKNYGKYKQFISTGTPTEEIKQILIKRQINHYFTEIFGSPQEKQYHIKQILFKYKLKSNELIFFGDSNTDFEAAQDANIKFILVKNKFNNDLSKDFKGTRIDNFVGL